MRRLRYSVASSLDGFIAGPNGEFDWIPMDPDIDFGAMFARYDTLLMGRKTYEASAAYPEEHMGMWRGMRVIVCSHTLAAATHSEVWSRDVATRIRALKAYSGQSGQVIRFNSARRSGSIRPAHPVHFGQALAVMR